MPVANQPTPVAPKLDPSVVNLALAIKKTETGGVSKPGASGENGAYQWLNWSHAAQQYLGDPNAPLTPENEDHAAYLKISDLKNQGLNPAQIASVWNHGNPNYTGVIGTNSQGVKYDTPGYVNKVYSTFQQYQKATQPQQQQTQPAATQSQSGPLGVGGDVSTGIAKSFMELPTQAAALGSKLGQFAASTPLGQMIGQQFIQPAAKALGITPQIAGQVGQGIQQGIGQAQQQYAPTNTAQAVGKGIGQVAQFALAPGEEGVAKAAEEAGTLSGGGLVGGLASTATKALGEGARAAGITAVQSGGDQGQTATAGALGAVLPVAGAVAGAFGRAAEAVGLGSEDVAGKLYNGILKPSKVDFSFGKNPGLTVAQEGITGLSKADLLTKIETAKDAVGKQIETLLAAPENATKTIPTSLLQTTMDEEIQAAGKRGDQALVNRLNNLKRALFDNLSVDSTGQIVSNGPKFGDTLTLQQANELKQAIGNNTQWTGQAFDKEVNQVGSRLYGTMKTAIEEQAPTIKQINQRWGGLNAAENALRRQVEVGQRRGLSFGMSDLAAAVASGLHSIPTTLGAIGLERALQSAPVISGTAQGVRALGKVAGSKAAGSLLKATLLESSKKSSK